MQHRVAQLSLVALTGIAFTSSAQAQFLSAPVFFFQPGVVTLDAVSPAVPTGSSTGLNFRFLVSVATPIPWLTAKIGTSFAPFGLSNGRRAFNEPTFFFGPDVMLLPRDRTNNWIELSLPVLGSYQLDENGEASRLYVTDLLVQGSALVPIGQKMLGDMGPFWSSLTLYGMIEQNLTPSRNLTTKKIDRFGPTFLYGVSIPIGGSSRTPR
jgi:hypothetical protein